MRADIHCCVPNHLRWPYFAPLDVLLQGSGCDTPAKSTQILNPENRRDRMAWDLTSYWSKDGTVGASRSMPRLRESPHFRSFVIRMSMTPRVCQAHPARSRTRTHETRQRQPLRAFIPTRQAHRTRVRSCSWNCQLRHRREALGHVDATLRLLDPSIDIDQIPNKRLTRRIKLFRQGELGGLIVGVLRESDTAGGHGS